MDSFEKFNDKQLPTKDKFYSLLNDEHISNEGYKHAQNVWNTVNQLTSLRAPTVQTLGEGEGEGSSKITRRVGGGGGWRMPSFLGRKPGGDFGQPAVVLAGNCMTTVVFKA